MQLGTRLRLQTLITTCTNNEETSRTFNAANIVVGEVNVSERDGRRGDVLDSVIVQPHDPDA